MEKHEESSPVEKRWKCGDCRKSLCPVCPGDSSAQPHQGEPVPLSRLREGLQHFLHPANPPTDPHWGDALQLPRVCRKAFSDSSTLLRHHRVHTGERPFSCPGCGKRFTQASNLLTLQQVHTGERPFSCPLCRKGFTSSTNLQRHQGVHVPSQGD